MPPSKKRTRITAAATKSRRSRPLTSLSDLTVPNSKLIKETNKEAKIVHIDDEGEASFIEQAPDIESKDDEVIFEASSFSTYALIITADYITAEGETYKITVTYDEEAGIPEGAKLKVREILQEEERDDAATEYENYIAETRSALNIDSGSFDYVRLFDISIVNGEEEIEPEKDGSVKVEMILGDVPDSANLQVVHFSDDPEIIDAEIAEAFKPLPKNAVDYFLIQLRH